LLGDFRKRIYKDQVPPLRGVEGIAVRLRANSSISTAQVPPLRGVKAMAFE